VPAKMTFKRLNARYFLSNYVSVKQTTPPTPTPAAVQTPAPRKETPMPNLPTPAESALEYEKAKLNAEVIAGYVKAGLISMELMSAMATLRSQNPTGFDRVIMQFSASATQKKVQQAAEAAAQAMLQEYRVRMDREAAAPNVLTAKKGG
jgi:hypothetical protein